MKGWKLFSAHLLGALLGTVSFWLALSAITQHSPMSVLQAAQLVVTADRSHVTDPIASSAINLLQADGLGISANTYFGRIVGFYGVVLQIALAAFVVFGFVSFLAIRWHSIQAAEDMVNARVIDYLGSKPFRATLRDLTDESFDLNVESLETQIGELSGLMERVEHVETLLARWENDEEPTNTDTEG